MRLASTIAGTFEPNILLFDPVLGTSKRPPPSWGSSASGTRSLGHVKVHHADATGTASNKRIPSDKHAYTDSCEYQLQIRPSYAEDGRSLCKGSSDAAYARSDKTIKVKARALPASGRSGTAVVTS